MVRRFKAGIPRQFQQTASAPISSDIQIVPEAEGDPAIQQKISETEQRIVRLTNEKDRLEDIQFRTGAGKQELSRKGNELANARSELRQLQEAQRTGETLQSAGQRIARAKQIRSEETARQRTGVQPKRTGLTSAQASARFEDEDRGVRIGSGTVTQTPLPPKKVTPRQPIIQSVPTGTVSRAEPVIPKLRKIDVFRSPIKVLTEQVVPRVSFSLTEQRSKLTTKRSRQSGVLGIKDTALALLVGAGISLTGTVQAVTHPVETVINIPSSVVGGVGFARSGALATVLRTQPALASGFIGTEVLTAFAGGKILSKGLEITGKGKTPKPESARIISFERTKGSKGGGILAFETESGRIGTFTTRSTTGKVTRTLGAGEIFEPKFKVGGELKKVNLQVFVGDIGSKSRRGTALQLIEEVDGIKVFKEKPIDKVAGIGRVSIAPAEKFIRTKFEITPRFKQRIFLEKVKGIQQLEFISEAIALKLESIPRTKFITGTIQSRLGTAGFGGFVFELLPKTKGEVKSITSGSGGKGLKLELPTKVKLVQEQADALAISTQSAQATASIKTPTISAIPSLKLSLDTKQKIDTIQIQPTRIVTKQTSIVKIMQGVDTRQLQITAQGLDTKQRVTTLTVQPTKQIQTPITQQIVIQRVTQRITPILKTGSITKTVTPLIPLIPPTKKIVPLPFSLKGLAPSRKQPQRFAVAKRTPTGFQSIGTGLSLGKATSLGQEFKTFKITPLDFGGAKGIRTPKGFLQLDGLIFKKKKKKGGKK